MSFRKEEKIILARVNYIEIRNLIKKMNGKSIFPKRRIRSIYFENSKYKMFKDSEEGVVPRKKIRLRNYPDEDKKSWCLEYKINSAEGKYKKTLETNLNNFNNYLKKGIYDNIYGNCFPNLIIEYTREYYQIKDVRITLDQNIYYKSYFNNNKIKKNDKLIIEFKTKNTNNIEMFNGEIPFRFTRMSKYCEAFTELYDPIHFYREKFA